MHAGLEAGLRIPTQARAARPRISAAFTADQMLGESTTLVEKKNNPASHTVTYFSHTCINLVKLTSNTIFMLLAFYLNDIVLIFSQLFVFKETTLCHDVALYSYAFFN